jgi:radical SAM protein with 4Fe4S-binding SPASM domain
MYFRLNPECYLATGKIGSVIYNLHTKEMIWLDKHASSQMIRCEAGAEVSGDNEICRDLSNGGWGFFSEKPTYVDKARPKNAFQERRLWQEAPSFEVAILQITNECNLNCRNCGRIFCPICMKNKNEKAVALNTDQWLYVIESIGEAGGQRILFTGGECTLHPDLDKLISGSRQHGMSVVIQTNGFRPLEKIPEDVVVSVLVRNSTSFARIAKSVYGRQKVEFMCSDFEVSRISHKFANAWTARKVISEGPLISETSLYECGLDRFFTRRSRDSCLNGKMFIRYDGSLVPCYERPADILGNVVHDDFSLLYKVLINEFWNKPFVKSAPDHKCGQCEFVYACGACRFKNAGKRCLYEPERGSWKQVGGNGGSRSDGIPDMKGGERDKGNSARRKQPSQRKQKEN